LTKPPNESDRSALPDGWQFADWTKAADARKQWNDMQEQVRQKFRVRFMEIVVTPLLPKEKCHYSEGIGKAKVKYPSPGWRALFFRDGAIRYITHFDLKGDHDHDTQIMIALRAQNEHVKRKSAMPRKGRK
jgi:hypothetical protein